MPIMQTVIQGGGTTPTGTKNITANGVHDVAGYASADVQVPTTAPALYRVFRVNNGKLTNSVSTPFLTLPNSVTDIDAYALASCYAYTPSDILYGAIDLSSLTTISGTSACLYMFRNCPGITGVNLSSLTTISATNGCGYMFENCTGITSVNLQNLTTVSGNAACNYMFNSCSGLTSVDLSSLTSISIANACGYMFKDCTALTSINLSSLTTISGNTPCISMFQNCSNLISFKANKLNTIVNQVSPSYGQMFYGCTTLESIEFGGFKASTFSSSKTQIQFICNVSTGSAAPNGCTIHFPSNFDPNNPDKTFDITTLGGYPTFGGNASYIHLAYDLPATE